VVVGEGIAGAAGSVRELAAGACRSVLADPALEPLWDEAEAGLRRLGQRLQVAVTGRVSAGKSTLVNALVGRRAAATGESETTSVNCAFRLAEPGADERAEVRLAGHAGTVSVPVADARTLTGVDTTVPIPLEIRLHHPLLERLTVIDSPGLGSPNEDRSERAARVTGATRSAIGVADAVLFVTSELPGRESEYEELDRFRRLFGDVRRAPTNTVYVFNQADRIEGPAVPDPVSRLRGRLDRPDRRLELRQRVAAATATVGVLAEAARTDVMDAALVSDLRRLGRAARDPEDLADGLRLNALAVPDVPIGRRAELIARLGGFGLVAGARLVCEDGVQDVETLRRRFLELSGIAHLEQLVASTFAQRSELLRSDTTLGRLVTSATRLRVEGAITGSARSRVDRWVHEVRLHPQAHPLRELNALLLSFEPRLGLDEESLHEVRDLLRGGSGLTVEEAEAAADVEYVAAWARRRTVRWRDFAERLPETDRREVAEVTALSYERLEARLAQSAGQLGDRP
jgi:hypothetical protein